MIRIDWDRHWKDSVDIYLGNRDLARLRPILKKYLHGKIADIGCGVNTIYRPGDDVTGVDISPECVRIMSERYPFGKWIVGDARNTGLPEAAYDTVVCSHVLEHFWDQTTIIEEMKRICKPDGDIVIAVPRNSNGPDHVHPKWYPSKIEDRIACHLKDATYIHCARAHWIIKGKRTAAAIVVTIAWSPTDHRMTTMKGSVKSFRNATKYPHKWVVVDNGPAGQTEFIKALSPDVHIINKELHNPAQSRNIGAMAAAGDYIAFVDNDARFYERWLEDSIAILEKYPQHKLIVVPTDCPVMRRGKFQAGELDGYKLSKLSGSLCWVMKRRSFMEIGRWNETDTAEDIDYSYRAVGAGYLFLYNGKPPYIKHLAWHNRTRETGDRFVNGNWIHPPANPKTAEGKKRVMLIQYAKRFDLKTFVETGTYKGDTVKTMLLSSLFENIYSVDIDKTRAARAKRRFRSFKFIQCDHGDSAVWLPQVLREINEPALFWLDAHASYEQVLKSGVPTPILDEIRAIVSHRKDHVVLIDDARYYDGNLKDYPTFDQIKSLFPPEWNCKVIGDIIHAYNDEKTG